MSDTQSQKVFSKGQDIVKQGEMGESAYIIEEGRVEILIQNPNGGEQSVGTRGPGSMIGEMAIVDKAPRTATVRATEDCKLLEITADDFSRRLQNTDPVVQMTTQVILARYRDTLTRAEITGENKSWPPVETLELNYAEHKKVVENVKIANEFKSALDSKELILHYQPIIDIQNMQVRGYEALMRWNHPLKGPISPGVFIPVAEESGLIVMASKWALRESLQALKRMEERLGMQKQLFMSVNFSSYDFASEDFTDSVFETISASDVDANQVHLEITERLLISQPENAKDVLKMCQKAGMGISIDDFGTGYSSLSYLHYFPIDTLKIDQSFIRDMNKSENTFELVRSIISLGQNLKMKVVAEGVETQEELDQLKELGCDLAQGYLMAKPMSESDITNFTAKWYKEH